MVELKFGMCRTTVALWKSNGWVDQIGLRSRFFHTDGQCLAASGGRYDAVYVWHIETGEQIAKLTVAEELQRPRHPPPAIPLAFSPDGKSLIGATPENTFSVWDIETGERRAHLTGHSAMVIYLLFSPCGEFFTSVDWDGGLHKWEVDKLTTKDPQPLIRSMPEATKSVTTPIRLRVFCLLRRLLERLLPFGM